MSLCNPNALYASVITAAMLSSSGVYASESGSCDLNLKLTMDAEMMPGGSQFKGDLEEAANAMTGMKMDGDSGMKMDSGMDMGDESDTTTAMNSEGDGESTTGMTMASSGDDDSGEMAGAHDIHEGQYGGTFFMAPNKTNHVEGIYSEDCGFQLVLFNAMTQPINVGRFGAFVKYIPEDEDDPEFYRILLPSHDGSVLEVSSNPEIHGEFDVELYVTFPGVDEPSMFNIRVEH